MNAMFLAENPLMVVLGHALDHHMFGKEGNIFSISKFTFMMWLCAAILLLLLGMAKKNSLVPSGILRGAFESLYIFIRDELVYPAMGHHHGHHFVPFFCTIFSFILILNLMGLVPVPVIGGAATSTLGFTVPMAGIILLVSIGAGLYYHGPIGFIKIFIPPGVPGWLAPVLFLLEFVGFFIKHGVLAIRLFANMLGGHMVVGAFFGLIFLFKSYAVSLGAIPLALFISVLEVLVAFLQAYVFTLLSVLFIGGTVHPEH